MGTRIAVASGKGGTGKTSLAVSLALALSQDGEPWVTPGAQPLFLDCDVEAPDAHLFLHPEMDSSKEVTLRIPGVDQDRCTLCGECVEVCQYNALDADLPGRSHRRGPESFGAAGGGLVRRDSFRPWNSECRGGHGRSGNP